MLRAHDFRNLQEVEAQRRWWHNRALHNAFGIAEGLDCALTSSPSYSVLVNPGIAYDSFGRELILERTQSVAPPLNISPQFNGDVSLLMRYKPLPRPIDSGSRSEICWCGTGSVVAGTAEFVWMQGDRFDPCAGVPVCALSIKGGEMLRRLNPNLKKPSTKPVARPLLGSGATIAGNTAWEPWSAGFSLDENDNPIPNYLGVQTWVDTSAAGFTRVPCYFASLQGPLRSPQTKRLVPALFPSIANESLAGFTFRLWLQVIEPPAVQFEALTARSVEEPNFLYVTWPDDFSLYAQQEGLYVSWIGCQMAASVASCASAASGVNTTVSSLQPL
jgi:hypothetical protein